MEPERRPASYLRQNFTWPSIATLRRPANAVPQAFRCKHARRGSIDTKAPRTSIQRHCCGLASLPRPPSRLRKCGVNELPEASASDARGCSSRMTHSRNAQTPKDGDTSLAGRQRTDTISCIQSQRIANFRCMQAVRSPCDPSPPSDC